MPDFILSEVEAGVGTITLNRPEKLNAYTTEMGDEVTAAIRAWRDDTAVRAVVLTGAGRGFCAGVDLEHLKAHKAGENASKGPRLGEEDFLKKLPLEMASYPKPLIAAINGAAIGVGVTMILPCDIRIAAEGAKIGFAFAKLGILAGLGSTHLLPRIVGRAKALELLMSARTILADEALACGLVNRVVPADKLLSEARELACGLVNRVVPADKLLSEARELAKTIAANPAPAVEAAKAGINFGHEHSMQEAMRNEERLSAELREKMGRKG